MHVDYFSGAVIDLKRGQRTAENVLAILAKHPRVSTWDMGEFPWLRKVIKNLEQRGLIEARDEPYPWHRYAVTDAGMVSIETGDVMPKVLNKYRDGMPKGAERKGKGLTAS